MAPMTLVPKAPVPPAAVPPHAVAAVTPRPEEALGDQKAAHSSGRAGPHSRHRVQQRAHAPRMLPRPALHPGCRQVRVDTATQETLFPHPHKHGRRNPRKGMRQESGTETPAPRHRLLGGLNGRRGERGRARGLRRPGRAAARSPSELWPRSPAERSLLGAPTPPPSWSLFNDAPCAALWEGRRGRPIGAPRRLTHSPAPPAGGAGKRAGAGVVPRTGRGLR